MLNISYQVIDPRTMLVGLSSANKVEIIERYYSAYNHKLTDTELHWGNEEEEPFFAFFYVKLKFRPAEEVWREYFFNVSLFELLNTDTTIYKHKKDGFKELATTMADNKFKQITEERLYQTNHNAFIIGV